MKYRDIYSSLFLFILGLIIFKEGFRLGLKIKGEMGPGFFPVIAGGFLAIISFFLFIKGSSKN